jgi:hypothetical protein
MWSCYDERCREKGLELGINTIRIKTREVSKILGVSYHRVINLIRFFKIAPPRKDSSGDYVWDDQAVQRAWEALNGSRRGVACRRKSGEARGYYPRASTDSTSLFRAASADTSL